MRAYLDTVESPAGTLAFAVNENGSLIQVEFREGNYERTVEQKLEDEGYKLVRNRDRTAQACVEFSQYCTGERREFSLPLMLYGSEWQKAVWEALCCIPFGETRSYAEVAAMVGRPTAARAVGRANATNRLAVVVPCHRVISADGSLAGFTGGVYLKERLLQHERRVLYADARR